MSKLIRELLKIHRQERGEIILITLAFMLLGFLLIVPLVSFMGTGLKSGKVFDKKSASLYAADAGVEDGMWKIKYGHLDSLDSPADYDEYDFNTEWQYSLPEQKNGVDVDVTVQNLWMPGNIAVPTIEAASASANDDTIMVTTGPVGNSIQSLKITLTHNPEMDKTLLIDSIGVWLPPGFTFVTGSSNLEEAGEDYFSVPAVSDYHGGQSIIWSFDSLSFISFPGANDSDSPITSDITFDFIRSGNTSTQLSASASAGATSIQVASTTGFPTAGSLILPGESELVTYTAVTATTFSGIPSSGPGSIDQSHGSGETVSLPTQPDAVSWITGKEVDLVNETPLFTWDIDVKVFKIHAEAGDTEVDTFLAKRELRKQSGAINGEYYATGNTLLKDTNGNNYRDTVVDPSNATVTGSNIPADAEVAAAYLYWSAWKSASPVFSDTCSSTNLSTNLWVNGGDWSYIGYSPYNYQAHHSGDDSNRYLTMKTAVDLSSYGPKMVTLAWDQWISSPTSLFSESCGNFDNWDRSGTDPYDDTAWDRARVSYNYAFKGCYDPDPSPGPDDYTFLTLKSSILDLSSASGSTVNISWKQWRNTTLESGDKLYFAFSNDDFATSSEQFDTEIAGTPTSRPYNRNFTVSVPQEYLTDTVKIRFYMTGFSSYRCCYLDDFIVTVEYSDADGLDVDFSGDNGTTWWGDSHALFQAFREDIGTSAVHYSLVVPSQYLTGQFKMRLRLAGMSAPGLCCNIDNISIMVPDHQITLLINGAQVYLDANGQPQEGSSPLIASEAQLMRNIEGSTYKGYSYSCFRDVTDLVRTYSTKAEDPATNYPGWGTYEVRDVDATTYPEDNWAYAGWSLVLVYTSAETLGHQLFLYDQFSYGGEYSDIDFDGDGQDGGIVSGFVVPARVQNEDGSWETNAAKLTCFVGEGDLPYTGDYITINGSSNYLSNSASPYNNVWNSASPDISASGVDIDTFSITWESGWISAGDTTAQINLPTGTDSWNLVYIILSFRNETITGGSMTYLIRG
ncbi:MAG: hypothetical protein JXA46_01420 [Dehalococcoidales bacterium]|nr:hypothetical protein [Dehalococcoidales bacterium]